MLRTVCNLSVEEEEEQDQKRGGGVKEKQKSEILGAA